jgi:hypothetical protein
MRASLLYFADCPTWRVAEQRLREALVLIGRPDVEVSLVPAGTDAEAAIVGFAGSPTFTVDGVDVFGGGATPGGLSCRVYETPGGLAGVPEMVDLVAALAERADR